MVDTESGDQSEYLANTVFGVAQEYVGDYFEIPAVMQSSRQWAYDPASGQKPTAEFLANLMMLTAKVSLRRLGLGHFHTRDTAHVAMSM